MARLNWSRARKWRDAELDPPDQLARRAAVAEANWIASAPRNRFAVRGNDRIAQFASRGRKERGRQ